MDIISLNYTKFLKFDFPNQDELPNKAVLEITNKSSSQNAAYKLKTTAKLVGVCPIQGIIAPGCTD